MKAVSLISGGIDSPVASYLMSRAGAEVVLLHMDNRPYADDRALRNVMDISKRLDEVLGKSLPLYVAPHGDSQKAISETCDRNYQCVMCKRAMQRTAKAFAKSIGASMIIMGDSLGQVASQTLKNIRAENIDLGFPVLRPLIGLDKIEIIGIAKEIGTFDLSIKESVGCTIVPHKVTVAAEPEKVRSFNGCLDLEEIARVSAEKAVLVRGEEDYREAVAGRGLL